MAEGKGGNKSFADCIPEILAILGKAEAYPDADPQLIASARELLIPAAQQAIASQDPMAQLQAAMAGGPAGPADPMAMQQAPTRLPSSPMDIGAV